MLQHFYIVSNLQMGVYIAISLYSIYQWYSNGRPQIGSIRTTG